MDIRILEADTYEEDAYQHVLKCYGWYAVAVDTGPNSTTSCHSCSATLLLLDGLLACSN